MEQAPYLCLSSYVILWLAVGTLGFPLVVLLERLRIATDAKMVLVCAVINVAVIAVMAMSPLESTPPLYAGAALGGLVGTMSMLVLQPWAMSHSVTHIEDAFLGMRTSVACVTIVALVQQPGGI